MNSFRYLLCMILILSNIEPLKGEYSIDSFINYLQEIGYFNLIQEIKLFYGEDIAVDVCEKLVDNNNCEAVVRVHMIDNGKSEIEDIEYANQVMRSINLMI